MTAYPERPIDPPEPAPSLEAEIEAISTDRPELAWVLAHDATALIELADLYKKGCRDGLLYFGVIEQAIRDEAERRYGEHIKERGI